MANSSLMLTSGTRLGAYEVVAQIGSGGMGEVYRARDTRLGREVAIKILPPTLSKDADRLRRFEQEARATSALNHPNIVTIYEIGDLNGARFIVTELIEGRTLRSQMAEQRLPLSTTIDIAAQVASALSVAHQVGIIHRDVKPDNIMVRSDGIVKVLDFGVAMMTERLPSEVDKDAATLQRVMTAPGTVIGTPQYMSPEQARGQVVDARSDLFSLGVVLYEMITGNAPFSGTSLADILVSILEREPTPLTQFYSGVPAELDRIVRRCLAKSRDQRYGTAQEMLTDLKDFARQLSQPVPVHKASPSIAVLPFVNMSADSENEYFCDGLAEELINALSKIESLQVAARTSAFSFKGRNVKATEIGQALNVSTILEGSVRKAGNRLRITAQLINVADGYHLWSERYDREMQDAFDIQDEISLAIVEALKVRLLGEEREAVLKRYTDNTEAYQYYLQGRFHYNRWTEEGFIRAIDCFKKALSIEPDYALALASLGLTFGTLVYFGFLSPAVGRVELKSAAVRAIAMDSHLAEGHYTMAMMQFYYEWDWAQAEQEFRRAIELNPSYAEARAQYGLLLAVLGRAEEAMAEGYRALSLDPLSLVTNMNVGWIMGFFERFDEMEKQGHRLIDLEPHFFGGYSLLAGVASLRGNYEEAIRESQKAVSLGGGPDVASQLGLLYGFIGEKEKAQQILDQLQELSAQRYVAPSHIARVYLGLGEMDCAYELFEQAYEQREGNLVHLKAIERQNSKVTADPRFNDLLRRVGVPR